MIKGNSGCHVEFLENVVRKSTYDVNYISRLQRQHEKQLEFFNSCKYVNVPEVLGSYIGKDKYFFDMEFIPSNNYIEYFLRANKKDIDYFIDNIQNFLLDNIKNSNIVIVNADVFLNKYKKINVKVSKNIHNFIMNYGNVKIPIGRCHGDLTLSNILFSNDKIYLIDFLDTFCESPLQDIVKLRQDIVYGWSMNLYKYSFDEFKIKIILEYINSKLTSFFETFDFYKHFLLFEVFNFLRIVPYCKSNKILNKTLECIEKLEIMI